MIQVGSREDINNYYISPALGQSKLKKLLGDISFFNQEEDSNKPHFVTGSAVDCILTGNPEDFDNQYYVSSVDKTPPEGVANILNLVHTMLLSDYTEHLSVTDPVQFKGDHFEVMQDSLEETIPVTSFADFVGNLNTWETYILDACKMTEWNSRWGDEAKLKNILPFGEFFIDMCTGYGKTILGKEQKDTIDMIVSCLKNNIRTSKYFDRDYLGELGRLQVFYQFPIYFTYRDVSCKALLDMVIVERDVTGEEIISVQGIDFKTMSGNTYNFATSIRSRRYDIQGAWYTLALQDYFAVNESKTKPFIFVVESTTCPGKPLTYKMAPSLLEIGKNGRKAISVVDVDFLEGGQDSTIVINAVKGYEQLLDMFIYHSANGFSAEKEILEQPVDVPLEVDWDGIVTNL